jgi:hypothetical protein
MYLFYFAQYRNYESDERNNEYIGLMINGDTFYI